MIFLNKTVSRICWTKLFRMSEFEELRVLKDQIVSGETMISNLKDEISQLMSLITKQQENDRIKKLQEENKTLQNEINLVKKELINLQIANGVPQIPVHGDGGIDVSEELSSQEPKVAPSTKKSENVVKSNDTKPTVKPTKPKKQASGQPQTEEPPIDVGRLDIRVGKVIHVQVHPDADQLYIEQIEVGEEISRTVVSGLVRHVSLSELDERMVLVLCNLKPNKIRGIVSEAMVLCASTPETVELLIPPASAKPGDKISVPGYPRNPDLPFMNPKKKIFEKVAEDLKVNSKKQAAYKDIPWQVEGREGYVTVEALSGCYIR